MLFLHLEKYNDLLLRNIMEMGNIQQFLNGKTIFVTGATGFLAKVFVEKLLRTQLDLKKLYILLRASDTAAATQRLHDEILGKELFRVVRDKWKSREEYDGFISNKVVAVAGDVCLPNLGLNDANLRLTMLEEIDVIVNIAGATNFNERFDVAMGANTMGALHVLNFAKICHHIHLLLHVSTAYVCGERPNEEVIKEEAFEMGESLKGDSKLDIEAEKNMMEKKLKELRSENASEDTIASAMKEYGIERARKYGWPNTYVFTKAMGEMLVIHHKDEMPLLIIRPTIITSTYNEPFPGWIEGLRTIDKLIVGNGKGRIRYFPGYFETIADVIPADMVVNSMIAAMAIHWNEAPKDFIYHVGSSSRNPLTASNLCDLSYLYFTKNPWTNKTTGKPIKISRVTFMSMASFHRHMMIRYVLPLKGLYLVNKVFGRSGEDAYVEGFRKHKMAMQMVELYKPYTFFKAKFDDRNTEKLREEIRKKEDDGKIELEFNPININWTDYMLNIHIPALLKYGIKS